MAWWRHYWLTNEHGDIPWRHCCYYGSWFTHLQNSTVIDNALHISNVCSFPDLSRIVKSNTREFLELPITISVTASIWYAAGKSAKLKCREVSNFLHNEFAKWRFSEKIVFRSILVDDRGTCVSQWLCKVSIKPVVTSPVFKCYSTICHHFLSMPKLLRHFLPLTSLSWALSSTVSRPRRSAEMQFQLKTASLLWAHRAELPECRWYKSGEKQHTSHKFQNIHHLSLQAPK